MINFDKFRKIAQTIQEIQVFQSVGYSLEVLPCSKESLSNLQALSSRELYERSFAIKPRPTDVRVGDAHLTPSSGMYRSWRELLEAAQLPKEEVDNYVQKLQAIDVNQVDLLDRTTLRNLGFKWGHILKIVRVDRSK